MNEETLAVEFINRNIKDILKIAKRTIGTVNDTVQTKLKFVYTEYLKNTEKKYSQTKSFFIKNKPVDLYSYYVPIGISSYRKKIRRPTLKKCLNASLHLAIKGTAGCGKSILMRHLFLDCIKNKQYVPVLIELRDLNNYDDDIYALILSTLDKFGFKVERNYYSKALEYGHFCFLFDGFDEVKKSLKDSLLKTIKDVSDKYSKCPIIISSRPDDSFYGFEKLSIFDMDSLTLESAIKLISKLPFDDETKKRFICDIRGGLFEKHKSFLSNPLLISIMLLTYSEYAEIPKKLSLFYNLAYEALFQRHDANKGGFSRDRLTSLDLQDFAKVFSLFSLQTYDKRLFNFTRINCLDFIKKSRDALSLKFEADHYLTDSLSATCLLIEDGLEISYAHRSFQEYFVALQIVNATPKVQNRLLNRYWENIKSDNVIKLIHEINPDVIERLLIVPKLDELFNSLHINEEITTENAIIFSRAFFNYLKVTNDNIVFSIRNETSSIFNLILFILNRYNFYKQPNKEKKEMRSRQFFINFGNQFRNKQICKDKFKTNEPIMLYLVSNGGLHSTDFIKSLFVLFQRLNFKHENAVNDIEDLLEIY